jgi:hypothetical protein
MNRPLRLANRLIVLGPGTVSSPLSLCALNQLVGLACVNKTCQACNGGDNDCFCGGNKTCSTTGFVCLSDRCVLNTGWAARADFVITT